MRGWFCDSVARAPQTEVTHCSNRKGHAKCIDGHLSTLSLWKSPKASSLLVRTRPRRTDVQFQVSVFSAVEAQLIIPLTNRNSDVAPRHPTDSPASRLHRLTHNRSYISIRLDHLKRDLFQRRRLLHNLRKMLLQIPFN